MILRLLTAEATSVEADLQVVKHFDGFVGGSERAINKALRGALRPVLDELEGERAPSSKLIRAQQNKIGSTRLLVLGLGPLDCFGLEDLRKAVQHAAFVAADHGFPTIATPVIGISDHVGLPTERAFRLLLTTYVSGIAGHLLKHGECAVEELTVFDRDPTKIDFFGRVTPTILSELGLDFDLAADCEFDVAVGCSTTKSTELAQSTTTIEELGSAGDAPARALSASVTRVLFLAANPQDSVPLRLDEEIREIDAAIRQAEYRASFDIRHHAALRVIDLQGHILRHRPRIVHFSGHGAASGSLVLEDVCGNCSTVAPEALVQLFAVFADEINCVVLNACFSQVQAEAITSVIDCVVGMSSSIDDAAAIGFARAFYQALAYGRSVDEAFRLGRVEVGLEGLPDGDVPQLLVRPGVDAHAVRFC